MILINIGGSNRLHPTPVDRRYYTYVEIEKFDRRFCPSAGTELYNGTNEKPTIVVETVPYP